MDAVVQHSAKVKQDWFELAFITPYYSTELTEQETVQLFKEACLYVC